MGTPKPYRSAMDAPIEIRATRRRSREVATHVWPDEVNSTKQRLADQGYTVTSVTDQTK